MGASERQEHRPFTESIVGAWKYVATNHLSADGAWTAEDAFVPFGEVVFRENGVVEEPDEEPRHRLAKYAFNGDTGQLCFRDMRFVVVRLTKDVLEYVDAEYAPTKYILERRTAAQRAFC